MGNEKDPKPPGGAELREAKVRRPRHTGQQVTPTGPPKHSDGPCDASMTHYDQDLSNSTIGLGPSTIGFLMRLIKSGTGGRSAEALSACIDCRVFGSGDRNTIR